MESDETNMPPFVGLASPRPIGLSDPQALADRIAALEAQLTEQVIESEGTIMALRAEVERLRDVLRNIALAGMSAPPHMHEDEVTHWHARRAWEFIGIAARGLDAALAAKDQK